MTNKDFRAKIFEAFSLDKKARKNVRRLFHSLLDVLLNICFYLCMLLAYVLIQVFVVTSFRIPSDSMLPAIMPGDCVWVDKCSGGSRLFNLWAAVDG